MRLSHISECFTFKADDSNAALVKAICSGLLLVQFLEGDVYLVATRDEVRLLLDL